jgi:predicted GNAT superfamily acetyltransferase
MSFNGSIKPIAAMDELKKVQTLERVVWDMEPIPLHQTFTAAKNGGVVLGAYEGDRLVGSLYSFPGFKREEPYLCSHMLAVHPDHRGRNIGVLLKKEQRRIAADMGYKLITWTFDPLMSLNAYLNLHKLGGVAAEYSVNLYGEMNDSLNQGLPTDRFTVHWRISSENENDESIFDEDVSAGQILLDENLHECCPSELGASRSWFVAIPADFQEIKRSDPDLALEWRMKSRKVFSGLLEAGFVGVDVKRKETSGSYYLFVKREAEDSEG